MISHVLVLARRALERVAPGLVEELEAEVEPLHREVKARWPRGRERRGRSFHSKDRWRYELVISPDQDTIRARIVNDAPWVFVVRPRWLYGKTGVNEMVRRPMRRIRTRLKRRLVRRALQAMKGG